MPSTRVSDFIFPFQLNFFHWDFTTSWFYSAVLASLMATHTHKYVCVCVPLFFPLIIGSRGDCEIYEKLRFPSFFFLRHEKEEENCAFLWLVTYVRGPEYTWRRCFAIVLILSAGDGDGWGNMNGFRGWGGRLVRSMNGWNCTAMGLIMDSNVKFCSWSTVGLRWNISYEFWLIQERTQLFLKAIEGKNLSNMEYTSCEPQNSEFIYFRSNNKTFGPKLFKTATLSQQQWVLLELQYLEWPHDLGFLQISSTELSWN